MVFAPNLGGVEVIVWVMLAVPLLIGMFGIVIMSCQGAEAEVKLSRARHLFATMVATLIGCLIFAGLIWLALINVQKLGMLLLLVSVAAVMSSIIAYQFAGIISTDLNWYRCRHCGARFRSPRAPDACDSCARSEELP